MREIGVISVQLHDAISIEGIKRIRDSFPSGYIIKTIHVQNRKKSIEQAIYLQDYVDALLLDTRTDDCLGGTGKVHDWSISAEIVSNVKKPVFLTGGLSPQNICSAIEMVKPFGVDVNSGVENN